MIEHYYQNLTGWFDWQDVYERVAKESPSGSTVVEVGCWEGKSLSFLLVEMVNRNRDVRIFGVDHFKGSVDQDLEWMREQARDYPIQKTCLANCQRSGYPHFSLLPTSSMEAAILFEDKSVWCMFLDASHDYNSVRADLMAWKPKMNPRRVDDGARLEGNGAEQGGERTATPSSGSLRLMLGGDGVMAKVKLLSFWLGGKPRWFNGYVLQWRRFKCIDWEHLEFPGHGSKDQRQSLNTYATIKLGFPCRKNESHFAVCDYRPAFGELFADKYAGYDWWGWVDLDVLMGDADRILPPLLEDCDVLTFKNKYLSGCLTMLRNTPETVSLFRTGMYREVLGDERYHCWDESGHHRLPGESFYNLIRRSGLRMTQAEELYSYTAPMEHHAVRLENGKLYDEADKEVLFHHFMTDVWPL